jgi:hypothetical protein
MWDDDDGWDEDEPFEVPCELCGRMIEMVDTANGWKPMDLNGRPHICPERARENLSAMPDLTKQ